MLDDIKPLPDYNDPSWPCDKQGRLLVGRKMPNVVVGFGEGDVTITYSAGPKDSGLICSWAKPDEPTIIGGEKPSILVR
jgi:hypothetical protein